MKTDTVRGLLSLFGGEAEGGMKENEPVLTQQANDTGELEKSKASAAGEQVEAKRRSEAFRTLMEGEYKDQFTAYFQETFNRRFKEQKEMKEELERSRLILNEAATHFGVDVAELLDTIRAKKEKKLADECVAGEITPETVRESEASLSREEVEREIEQAVSQAVEKTRLDTEQAMIAGIRARGLRPSEGALSEVAGDALHGRANSLSRAQRAEVARRAARGERIKF